MHLVTTKKHDARVTKQTCEHMTLTVPVPTCALGSRMKTALLACVNTMAPRVSGWGRAVMAANARARQGPRWHDDNGCDSEWWRSLPTRSESSQIGLARLVHTWTRAYLVALQSIADIEGYKGDGCREVLKEMTAPENVDSEGRIKMGAVIASFARCPGEVVHETLCLLNWAGHVGKFTTLQGMEYALTAAVMAYWADKSRWLREDGMEVSYEPLTQCT